MKKNYIDHDIKVKYIDGILAHDREWQWLVDYIEENFDLEDINSWFYFFELNNRMKDIYSYFIRIVEVIEGDDLEFSNSLLREVYLIAKFYVGKISKEDVTLKFNYSKILFLMVWITKLQNQCNNTQYIIDLRLFTKKNMFELIDISKLILHESEIKDYLDDIKVEDSKEYIACLLNNLNQVSFQSNINFLEAYKDKILNADAFNYKSISPPTDITWQEEYILDMLCIKIENKEILPRSIINNIKYPDITCWSEDVLDKMKRYFENPLADFILETIAYVLYKIKPSQNTILIHLELFTELLRKEGITARKVKCSSLEIIKYLMDNKEMTECFKTTEYQSLMREIHNINNIDILEIILDCNFNLSKNQKNLINKYYESKYKEIDNISSNDNLLSYFQDENTVKSLTNEYFAKVSKKFYERIEEDSNIIPSLFYWYMRFLIRLNSSAYIDKQYLNHEIITLQAYWEQIFYDKCLSHLNHYEQSFAISNEVIEEYNNNILLNPTLMASKCILSSKEQICSLMESISEHALIYKFNRIHIDRLFPIEEKSSFDYNRHEIENTLKEMVNDIIDKQG